MGFLRKFVRWWLTWRPLYWLFRRQPGITVTVARPTTADGESLQLTTVAPVGATAMEIAGVVETLSLACQARMVRQNEIMLTSRLNIAHEKWKRIRAKLDAGGKLSKEENKWWGAHARDYDQDGPVAGVSDKKIQEAAEGPE